MVFKQKTNKKKLNGTEALSLPKLQMSLKKKLFFWSTSLMTQRKIELTYMCPTLFAKSDALQDAQKGFINS